MKLSFTQSLCPQCLRRVDAWYESEAAAEGETSMVYLRKFCPEHGLFSVPVWHGKGFAAWQKVKSPSHPANPESEPKKGCPFDCGLCPRHGQHTCTALVEITERCNLACPLCYADAGKKCAPDPDMEDLAERFASLASHAGGCNIQLSGGEPTLREDLPKIISLAQSHGFGLVQINSNGLRLAQPGYAQTLRGAGLDSVYLQWDSLRGEVCSTLRGGDFIPQKMQALECCAQAGLGVVLVMTVLHGVNDQDFGSMLAYALEQPGVRGLHIQPAAFFGRYLGDLATLPRLTLPQVMQKLESQSQGLVHQGDFHPPGCEHHLCSFSAMYRREEGKLIPFAQSSCCAGAALPAMASAREGARKSIAFVARHWAGEQKEQGQHGAEPASFQDAFSHFVAQAGAQQRFTLSGMAFQDALSLDLQRVRGCCIHVCVSGGKRIPFCLYNLTSSEGLPLYRKARQ